MIQLTFHTQDPDEIALVQKYWATGADGGFEVNVSELLPFRGITKTTQLVALIRQAAHAVDTNQICPSCGAFEEVTSRSSVKKVEQVMRSICKSCRGDADAERLAELARVQKELQDQLKIAAEKNAALSIDYNSLSDDIVLVFLALDRAITPRLSNGSFMLSDCTAVVPANLSDFISRLYKVGAIVDRPELARPNAYVIEEGVLYHYSSRVVYTLTPDKKLGGGESALNYFEQRELKDNSAIRNLWLDFATADCLAYLSSRCDLHRLTVEPYEWEAISSTLRDSLQRHSVSQLWSVIWKIVEDAAALSTRDYYNREKAAATLPKKLLTRLEKIERGLAHFGQEWKRPTLQPAGTLGQIFSEYYGIDECTLGSEVMSLFPEPVPADVASPDPSVEVLYEASTRLMHAALGHYSASEVLLCFAAAIRSGANVEEAIAQVFETYPFLSEPY